MEHLSRRVLTWRRLAHMKKLRINDAQLEFQFTLQPRHLQQHVPQWRQRVVSENQPAALRFVTR